MPSVTAPSIGVMLCSTRQPRVCPQIATFITQTFEKYPASVSNPPSPARLQLVDLAAWNLPLFDEPTIPSKITNPADYHQPHTRAWSAEIQTHAAFIFVLPQYNWGYPATIKNAIDYLFHEWHGKPAMFVSYGGHGGVKAAGQLRQILQGVRMTVAETMPALSFPSRAVLEQAARGEDLGLLREAAIWESKWEEVSKAFGELVALLSEGHSSLS